jgi:3-oxoadipate enol-lactonase
LSGRRPEAPDPPVAMPEGRIVQVPGRGELFLRDSGGSGTPVLLLHGWMFQSDLNWFRAYGPLADAGYRVLAMDHRGHGRGLRTHEPFRLSDCAGDAAALVDAIGAGPVIACGYSLGGAVAQLMARDHREHVRGLVCCATSSHWTEPRMRRTWRTMGALRLLLNLFPTAAWRRGLRLAGLPPTSTTNWMAAELTRGASVDLAEAGRELGRYDARPWLDSLRDLPAAVVVTAMDRDVPARLQDELAERLGAERFEVDGDHAAVTARAEVFNPVLIAALRSVEQRAARPRSEEAAA